MLHSSTAINCILKSLSYNGSFYIHPGVSKPWPPEAPIQPSPSPFHLALRQAVLPTSWEGILRAEEAAHTSSLYESVYKLV